jgi:cardiolipin synthase
LYDYLLRNGVEIYEWNESVLHGKAALMDGEWCTIGSYNLNNLSKYKTIEFNLDIKDTGFTEKFSKEIDSILEEKCTQVTKEDHLKKMNVFKRIQIAIAYSYYRLVMFMISSKE